MGDFLNMPDKIKHSNDNEIMTERMNSTSVLHKKMTNKDKDRQ